LHATFLVEGPIEALRPSRSSVRCLEYPYSVASACRPQHQAAEGSLVTVDFARADKNGIGVVGVYRDRTHSKHRVTGLDAVPVGSQPACVRPPEPAARGADIQRIPVLGIDRDADGPALEIGRSDRLPRLDRLRRASRFLRLL